MILAFFNTQNLFSNEDLPRKYSIGSVSLDVHYFKLTLRSDLKYLLIQEKHLCGLH